LIEGSSLWAVFLLMGEDGFMRHTLDGATVLVVDDSEMNVELLADMMERSNLKALVAMSGAEALQLARVHLPEIILLDITMPEMNGYDVCRQLKLDEATADIPVIFISALDDLDNIIEGFDAGGADYITKPFRFREVLARVSNQLIMYRQKRQIEKMRYRERQQFEKMDNLRRQFIGSTTHDLKNPLFVISGYTDMLETVLDVTDNEQAQKSIEAIRRGVGKMNTLIADILDLLQLESEVNLEKTEVPFTEFVFETVKDMRLGAEEKGLDYVVYAPDKEVIVVIDPLRMARVLENLVSNAIKYTPQGQVIIECKVRDTTVIIEVIDSGLGIPKEMLPNLFNPFERVDTEDHMAQEGTGLGLSIVKTLVEQHQGKIEVESVLGEGSIFRVILPL
jgi:two-component system, sensor histidine kinase and response regulator